MAQKTNIRLYWDKDNNPTNFGYVVCWDEIGDGSMVLTDLIHPLRSDNLQAAVEETRERLRCSIDEIQVCGNRARKQPRSCETATRVITFEKIREETEGARRLAERHNAKIWIDLCRRGPDYSPMTKSAHRNLQQHCAELGVDYQATLTVILEYHNVPIGSS
jgi:hypothetical protein